MTKEGSCSDFEPQILIVTTPKDAMIFKTWYLDTRFSNGKKQLTEFNQRKITKVKLAEQKGRFFLIFCMAKRK